MAKSKKEAMQQGIKPRPPLTSQEQADLAKTLLSPQSPLRKVLVVLEAPDLEWLDTTVGQLKATGRRRSNKSEMIKLAITQLKGKSVPELREMLRNFD
jgi:hypothetical protein